jgi:DNA-binding FadR family transcriptional regulator
VSAPDISLLSDSISTHLHLRGTTFQDLAEARQALETTAAQLAAQRATPEDLVALEVAIQGPMAPPIGIDTVASSLDFHTALVIASHNQALLAMFRATRALIQEAFDQLHAQQPDMAAAARKTHGELYAAIAERDAERAGELMRQHLEEFAARAARFYASANST